jgi:hypothetical protein
MISNPQQRDGTDGTAASASAELYKLRRQGNLTRASDGFRSPYPSREPRRPAEGGHVRFGPSTPYGNDDRHAESNARRYPPRTWPFFRPASLGAPRVNFPDAERCRGKYQQSGAAWGRFHEQTRPVLTPATNGKNAPPSHTLGKFVPGSAYAIGPRWRRPSSPRIFDSLPH